MNRESTLRLWLNTILPAQEYRIASLTGDASFRRYYRMFTKDASYIIMDAPPPEEPWRFVLIAELLRQQNLSVPQIIYQNLEQGFLVLSDFGDVLYLNALNETTVDALYREAMLALLKLQRISTAQLPTFGKQLFTEQLELFSEWYVLKHLKRTMNEDIRKTLSSIYEVLYEVFEIQPQVLVHRDYHSRNLMILSEVGPGILDFQDALSGPVTYDLVSLLQDCYIYWPREKIEHWVMQYYHWLIEENKISNQLPIKEFIRWFDLTGLQRHLKNLGVFARLHYRDGKSHYLKDIPNVLRNILETCERYNFLKPLQIFLQSIIEIKDRQQEAICVR